MLKRIIAVMTICGTVACGRGDSPSVPAAPTPAAFATAAHAAEQAGATFPLKKGETLDTLLARLQPNFFDPAVDPSVTNKTPPAGKDILTGSSNNLYVGLAMKDLEGFHERYP